MILLPYLLPISVLTARTDGTSKVETLKSILRGFGVPGPFRLQELNIGQFNDRFGGQASVSDRHKLIYTAYFQPNSDRISFLYRGNESTGYLGFQAKPLADKRIEQVVRGWAARIYGNEHVRLNAILVDQNKLAQADFSILRNGYPFVSTSQRYGYRITFHVPDMSFLALNVTENPPPVDSRPPAVSQGDAVKSFQHIFETVIAPGEYTRHSWLTTYKLIDHPTLGYYLEDGQKVAHLVWRIPFMQSRDVGYAIQGGSNAMLIDAITGRQVRTKGMP